MRTREPPGGTLHGFDDFDVLHVFFARPLQPRLDLNRQPNCLSLVEGLGNLSPQPNVIARPPSSSARPRTSRRSARRGGPCPRPHRKRKRALRLNVAILVATLFGDEEGKVALRWGVAAPRIKKRCPPRWRALSGLRPTAVSGSLGGRSWPEMTIAMPLDGVLLICSGHRPSG
jgi:hypothetical protein